MNARSVPDLVNAYNVERDVLRGIEQGKAGLDHTQLAQQERREKAKHAEIRLITDEIQKRYEAELEPEYRESILEISVARNRVEEVKVSLAAAEGLVSEAEADCYKKYLELSSAARAASKPKPHRFDVRGPRRHTGQISTWTPGLRV
ncbi:MAG: hypothetical protein IIA89_02040 [Chloroflexi bacterium]|nr:hypothetical protein [Chloroflexota bacterium]